MLLKSKIEKFKTFCDNNNVLTSIEERYCYSQDASNNFKDNYIPDGVVFVQSISDVQKVLTYANKNKIPVIARGAGTNMVGACLCPKGGIVLNFSKMNKILEFNPVDMTMRVEPGVVLADIKNMASDKGLFFPPDPSNYKVSTIGGAIAQSSGGAMSFKYGTTKDYVISLKVVTADGKLVTFGAETTKDASGYHLGQLIIGSEGTLAIVVEAVLKLIPKTKSRQLVTAYFKNLLELEAAINKIFEDKLTPSTIDFMDKNAIATVEDFLNIGLDTSQEGMLFVEFDGDENDVFQQVSSLNNILRGSDFSKIENATSEFEIERLWQARRSSYAASTRLAPDVITDDIIVPRKNLIEAIKSCNAIVLKYGLKLCLVGHIGDGNLHPQIVLDLNKEDEYVNYLRAKAELYDRIISLQGTVSAEHGIGLEKINYLEKVVDKEALILMKEIKKVFDPNNILNPGKIFK